MYFSKKSFELPGSLVRLLCARHPMTLVFETEAHGRLWLGGEKAVHNHKLLADNEVHAVWPACRSARPDSPHLLVFDVVDGTGACNGDIPLAQVARIVQSIVALLLQGKAVLVACHNGAHRSATLVVLIIIFLTAWTPQEAAAYLAKMRNIVDLSSRAPASNHRAVNKRPIDFLEEVGEKFRGERRSTPMEILGFVPLRRKALTAGFEARFSVPKSLATPMVRKRESSSEETVKSLELPATDAERASVGSVSWQFVTTPVTSPTNSETSEPSELRRRKIRMLMEDLTLLNKKLEGHVEASGGFEPGVTLRDASGAPAAVVVGSDLSLKAAAGSGEGAPPASLVGAPQASLEGAKSSDDKEQTIKTDPELTQPKAEGLDTEPSREASKPGVKEEQPASEEGAPGGKAPQADDTGPPAPHNIFLALFKFN